MNNKLKVKKLKDEFKNNCISIKKFLTRFCNLKLGKLDKLKISHNDILILIPSLKRVSFDDIIKNKNLIYNGDVIVIIDSYGEALPYLTPQIDEIITTDYEEQILAGISIDNDIKNLDGAIDEKLSCYELALLCKYYKDKGLVSNYRIVRELLKMKKNECSIEKYKTKKLELTMRGREEND